MKYWYLEQTHKGEVVRRVQTSEWRQENDFEKVRYLAPKDHKVNLVVSSEREKVIN